MAETLLHGPLAERDFDPPPGARRSAGRFAWRLVQIAGTVALIVCLVATSLTARNQRARIDGQDAEARFRNGNVLLLEQQLDQLFQSQSDAWSGAPPTPDDRKLIEVWSTFDAAFLARNLGNAALAYERAVTHERAGRCALLLGNCPHAIEHVLEARRLYEELAAVDPDVPDYWSDVARATVLLGEARLAGGETEEAVRAYREAIAIIGDPEFSRTAEGDRLLAEWNARLSAVSAAEGSPDR